MAAMVAKCVEFPSDNPSLWGQEASAVQAALAEPPADATPTQPMATEVEAAIPESPLPNAVAAAENEAILEVVDEIEVVEEITFDDAVEMEEPPLPPAPAATIESSPPPAASQDPFGSLVRVMQDVAGAEGASLMPMLLGQSRLDASTLTESAADALVAGGVLEKSAKGLVRGAAFTARVVGWQGILRGESEDFGACGAATLDEWAADVIARALGNPARADKLRRELRARGVAAFGLLGQAA